MTADEMAFMCFVKNDGEGISSSGICRQKRKYFGFSRIRADDYDILITCLDGYVLDLPWSAI
ncbi:hypothetical protein [Sphingomonas parapaucimobilis]|uniref:hypothetical protein n=1 Tax=Sphingomonas parapaucimobilis TaxID=28213 RepID=UPI00391BB20F